MDLIITYLGLRYLAQLLKAENTKAAGDQLDRDLNGVAEGASSCAKVGCGCYVVLCVGSLVVAAIDWLVGLVAGR